MVVHWSNRLSVAMKDDEANLFQFEGCTYEVGGGSKRKMILKGVSGSVSSGHVLSIMGPSGAGKTTLLKMLALDKGGGRPGGSITLNGEPFTKDLYSQVHTPPPPPLWRIEKKRPTSQVASFSSPR